MARIALHIDDLATRLTLQTMLASEGHEIVGQGEELAIAEDPGRALRLLGGRPVLVLAYAADREAAIAAMERGVYGCILLPLAPREPGIMVSRALAARAPAEDASDADDAPWPTLDIVETRHILATLRHCRNNHSKAARMLGIGRNTLWRKLNRLHGRRPARVEEAEDPGDP